MHDPFASPKRRLDRAHNRISELGEVIEKYWQQSPYAYWRERDLTVFAPNVVASVRRKIHIPSTNSDWEVPDPPVWDRTNNQVVYLRTPPGADVPHDVEITFTISFAGVEGVELVPSVDVLWAMADEVNRVLESTEAECRKFGWIV